MSDKPSLVEEALKNQGKSMANIITDAVRQFMTVEGYPEIYTKTRLGKPDGMTYFEEIMLYYADDKDQRTLLGLKGKRKMTAFDFMKFGAMETRVNQIPKGEGLARQESVQVALGATAAQEKSMKEKALEGFGWNR